MNYIQPEKAGILSKNILNYLKYLEKYNLATHDIIIAKGNDIVFEKYWKPFDENFLHRMYSVSKSFVSLAIGFLEQDGVISLDDKISKYFAEEIKDQTDENMRNQTIRNMLMMSTAKEERFWFDAKPSDRVKFYFENDRPYSRKPGILFQYDSTGSFVLGALVERLTKKELAEYLREKLFNKIGVSEGAHFLKCPGGHSWGDSALLCTPRDLLKTARFVMNGGRWNGEQILNEDYIKSAVSRQIDNDEYGVQNIQTQGYGYLFWRAYNNSYYFNGMGCQFAVCVPDEDIIFVYNGDNQGNNLAKEIVIGGFFDIVLKGEADYITESDGENLEDYCKDLELISALGEKHSKFADEINGKKFVLDKNPMNISEFKLVFDGEKGKFIYKNAQGDKEIEFGMCKNVYGKFPEEGYSDETGTVFAPRHYYGCAASAAWTKEKNLFIKVQIIDKYFGNLNINIGFNNNGEATIRMEKFAEDFLKEYQGFAGGKMTK